MPKYNPQEYFDRIKENHRRYLERTMITHLEITGGLEQAELVQKYVRDIGYYRDEKAIYLDSAIEQIPTMDKIKQGALSALMGIGVGGLTQYASAAVPNPVAAAVAPVLPGGMVTGAFSALLGAGAGYLMYKIWESNREKPAAADFNEFQNAMKQAGFTHEKYNELSADVVKLFHFRECLLLGAIDNSGNNMREEFKRKYYQQNVDEKSLNTAIEAYFLEQLNDLFNKAFAKIYDVHDQEIKDDKNRTIIQWIKDYFQKPQNRQVFTQQLQIEFMKQCIGFLEKEMNEPSFMAKHPYVPMLVTGLVAGAVALGIGAAIVGGPLTLAIGIIAIVITCVAAVGTYFAVKHIDALRFKRGPENRASLKNVIEDVTKEALRLNTLIKRAVETDPGDIESLKKHNQEYVKNIVTYIMGAEKEVARGSASSWIREYASRYRHNMIVENDLQQQETQLINDAENQTEKMQKELQLSVKNGKLTPALDKFIQDTSRYLMTAENKEFIKKFAIIEKIRHQFLEITAAVDKDAVLPKEFSKFYISSLQKGGLGGLEQDLKHVREFAPIMNQQDLANHPYQKMLVAAQRCFNVAIVQDANYPLMFTGDDLYRDLLGLSTSNQHEHIEDKLTPANIQSYLNNSFDFLYTLNEQVKLNENESSLTTPFINRPEFIIYRMALLKQLAHLADINNLRVQDSVRSEIKRFVREKFNLDPDLLFDNLINQSLFLNPAAEDENEVDNYIIDPLGEKRPLKQLDFLAECLRMDMAYASMPITPKTLIQAEAEQFIIHKAEGSKTIFCHEKSQKNLRPSASANANTLLFNAINNTQAFIQIMAEKPVMKKSGALASYITDTVSEVIKLQEQYQELLKRVGNNAKIRIFPEQAIKALDEFKGKLLDILATAPREENLLSSSLRFGTFESSIDLSKYEQEWVVVDFELNKNPEETFIDEIKKFIAQHERRAQGFFGSNTSRDLCAAAKKFLEALETRKANEQVDLSFLTENPQQFGNSELGLLIQKNIRLCNAVSIEQFFSREESSEPNFVRMGNHN